MMKQRILWIDYAKVIGIYLVILAHLPSGIIGFSIYSFHMPLFFIISGMLYNKSSNIKKSFERLLLPVIIYTTLGIILIYIFNQNRYLLNEMKPYLILNHKQMNYFFIPLWFVVTLFLQRSFTYIFSKFKCTQLGCFAISIVTFIISIILKNSKINIEIADFDTFLFTYIFFQIGYTFKDKIAKIIQRPIYVHEILLLIVTLPLWIYLITLNGTINIFRLEYGKHLSLFFLNLSYGSMLTFRISYILAQKQQLHKTIIQNISNGTLSILALHLILVKCYITYVIPFTHNLPSVIQMILYCIAAGCFIIIFIPINFIFKKYTPILS